MGEICAESDRFDNKRIMKIFIVSPTLTNGGAERVASMLAKGFSKRGHEVTVVTHTDQKISYDPGPKVKLLPIAPDKSNSAVKWITSIKWLRSYIKREQPDVIIGIMGVCSYLSRLAAIGTKTKVILTEHSAFERIPGYPLQTRVKYTRKWIDFRFRYITVLSEQDKKVGGRKYSHAVVMPNPLAYQTYEGNLRDLYKEKTVLAAGRISNWYVKGFDVLIEAWSILVHKKSFDSSWKLKIAGAGSEADMQHLMNLCKEYQVEDRIDFLGFRNDMLDLYRKSEIFCLSSRSEGMPMSLLEAMSQGCAPVATDYKGRTKNIISNQDTGLVCIPQDPVSLAEGLWRMMNDDVYRKKVQLNALERSRHYSLDHVIMLWENMLNTIKENGNA